MFYLKSQNYFDIYFTPIISLSATLVAAFLWAQLRECHCIVRHLFLAFVNSICISFSGRVLAGSPLALSSFRLMSFVVLSSWRAS